MIEIRNKRKLIENGETSLICRCRILALECLEHAVTAVEPRQLIKAKVKVEKSYLQLEGYTFDLRKFKHVYVVGGGKAGSKMAQAIEELLGKHVTAGAVNIPYGTKMETCIIGLNEAGHPFPDEAGVKGTVRIMELAEQAKENDLVICLISGGGSSLMPLPREGISLKDKQALTKALLKSGAEITEINIVRKHLSAFKGGWLAKKAYPATVLNLVLSDVIGDSLYSIASGPTVADPSTFSDARKILEKYDLWSNAPVSIRKIISEGEEGLLQETPKPDDLVFGKVYNVVIGNNQTACQAAVNYLRSEGFSTLLLTDTLNGEAKVAGEALAKFANDISVCNPSTPKLIGIVVGGETTVTVKGKGLGGRNQELALSAALNLNDAEECVIASFNTDGLDGPTDLAGAIVDGYTLRRARILGLNPKKYLENNDSYNFFFKLGDLINTGITGTNVNDIAVILRKQSLI
ncbi:MAG: glycerate kinase [Candidatus Bathyarchaeota archaeon]|nr:glycerate kinase [Candidatus Bathyarchaeota archaeon]